MHMLGIHSFESMYEPFLPVVLLLDLDVRASSSDDDGVFTLRSSGYSGSVGVAPSSVLVQPFLSGHEEKFLSISYTPLSPPPLRLLLYPPLFGPPNQGRNAQWFPPCRNSNFKQPLFIRPGNLSGRHQRSSRGPFCL